MATITFVPGTMQELVVSMSFTLNFEEDHKKSVKVQPGDTILFDGIQARYRKKDGSDVEGKAPSLKAACNMNWLSPKDGSKVQVDPAATATVKGQKGDNIPPAKGPHFDGLRGGDFDAMIAEERKSSVIREEDRIVKRTGTDKKAEKKEVEKLEVAGDQVEVKDRIVVNSSTSESPIKGHKREIRQGEDYGADSSTPLRMKTAKKDEKPGKVTFTVDETTPQLPEDATADEVKRVTAVKQEESQEAKVVRSIRKPKVDMVEGIKVKTTVESSDKPIEDKATVGSGGDTVVDVSAATEGVKVVAKKDPLAVNTGKKENPDYLSMLPEDWGELHWVKKERLIKSLVDVGFIKFILTVDTTPAIQKACKARLEELSKKK